MMSNDIHNKLSDLYDLVHKIDKDATVQKNTFEDHLTRDEEMFNEFKRMNNILQQNTDSLREHMRRTDILEDIVQKIDLRFTPIEIAHIEVQVITKYKLEKKKKIKDAIIFWTKVVGGISATIAIYVAIKTFSH
jgi:hypothetical protein